MPITGRSADDCYRAFRDHVAKVVAATLTPSIPLKIQIVHDRVTLTFVQGDPTTVPLITRYGVLHFRFSQALQTVRHSRSEVRLRTVGYWYRIQKHPGLKEKALVRWEYEASHDPANHNPARHHVQLGAELQHEVGAEPMDLDKLHLPTGRVPFEEVIRFLICDLRVTPPCGDRWPEVLASSEKAFHTRFATSDYPMY